MHGFSVNGVFVCMRRNAVCVRREACKGSGVCFLETGCGGGGVCVCNGCAVCMATAEISDKDTANLADSVLQDQFVPRKH